MMNSQSTVGRYGPEYMRGRARGLRDMAAKVSEQIADAASLLEVAERFEELARAQEADDALWQQGFRIAPIHKSNPATGN